LMAALQARQPQVPMQFVGIGGTQMLAQGLQAWEPLESLSVMGLVEVLSQLPRLWQLRRRLIQRWLRDPPDLFIGIDAPDFNLPLAKRLRAAGVPTVHYVCPSVWAWRPGRVRKIQAAVDLLLSIFPFEQAWLRERGMDCTYVGHTLAAQIPMQPDPLAARQALGIEATAPVLALLPGSRQGEISRLAPSFLATAAQCRQQIPGLQIVAPMANAAMLAYWQTQIARYAPDLPVHTVLQTSQTVLTAADAALIASGTATLEALLCRCPMVVGYQLQPLSYWLLQTLRLVQMERVVLANLLAEESLAPAYFQRQCTVEQLVPAVLRFLQTPALVEQIRARYAVVHQTLQVETDQHIAEAIFGLLQKRGVVSGTL